METLKDKTAKSLFWAVLNNGSLQLLNILFGVVLARLLTPGDYGIVGVLTIFTLIAGNLQSGGFSQGLINLKSPQSNDYNSVFWFNVIISGILYAFLWFCSPLIAAFFHQPVLVGVSRFVFLSFLISSLGIAHGAYMSKNMMNREIAIINIIALLCSGMTGIVLAYLGFSYWSLAWQQVIFISITNLGRFYYVPWRPSFAVDFGPVKRMFSFSVKILITNIINTLNGQILTLIFGRLFHISVVGLFTQANKWNTQAHSFVSGTLLQVAQPVLVSVSEDRERLLRVFRKMLRFSAFISFPVMLGLAFVSKEFILVALGEKWVDCFPLLRILCVAGAFMPFYTVFQNLTIGCKRSDIYLWCNVGLIVAQIVCILLCYYCFSQSIVAVVIVYSFILVAWLAVWQQVAARLTGLSWKDTLMDIVPFLVITASVIGISCVFTMWIHNVWLLLASKVLISVLLYVFIMKTLKVKIFTECIEFAKQKISRK